MRRSVARGRFAPTVPLVSSSADRVQALMAMPLDELWAQLVALPGRPGDPRRTPRYRRLTGPKGLARNSFIPGRLRRMDYLNVSALSVA